jgi:hypothetical protein
MPRSGSRPPAGEVKLIGRFRVPTLAPMIELAVTTEQVVRIRETPYRRATLRGVPGKHADLIIIERLLTGRRRAEHEVPVLEVTDRADPLGPAWQPVLEVGFKAGRYDGAIRRRYALRLFRAPAAAGLSLADLRVVEDGPDWLEIIIAPRDAPALIDRWPRLRADLDDYDLSRIAGWHWRNYYRHLTDEDQTRLICDQWEQEVRASGIADDWTLSEANQAASRMLYEYSRALGWRKLTRAMKQRLGIDPDAITRQWWPEAELTQLYIDMGYPATGCGEGSTTAAREGHWPALDEPLTAAEALELEFDEAYPMR